MTSYFGCRYFSGRLFETAYVKREHITYNNNIEIDIIYYIYDFFRKSPTIGIIQAHTGRFTHLVFSKN